MRLISYFVPGALFLLTSGVAQAQTDLERATARDAANSGRQAFDAGQYEKAIDSFTRAESLVHAPPHLLFLARSQAKLGQLVAAHETYLKVTRETLKPNAPKAFSDAQTAAEQELPAVDARLPYVTVTLRGAPADGVTVLMDSTSLPAAMIGIPLPADPGQHVFKATGSATGDPVTVSFAEGAKQTVVLKVHSTGVPAADATPVAAGSAHSSLASPAQGEPLTADTSEAKGSGLRVASYVSFGLGAVGLGAGTYFLVKSHGTRNEATQLFTECSTYGACKDKVDAKDHDADSQLTLGVAGLVVGGLGVALGVTFLIVDSSSGSSKSAKSNEPHVVPVIGLNTLGLAGTF